MNATMILLPARREFKQVPSRSSRLTHERSCLAWDTEAKRVCGRRAMITAPHGWTCGDHDRVRSTARPIVDTRSEEEILCQTMQREVDRSHE